MKKYLLLLTVAWPACLLWSQNIGIGTTTPNSSAVLDISSNNKGILVPRLTQSERIAIPAPATGLLVYQSDADSCFFWHNGVTWIRLLSTRSGWELSGNAATTDNNFIGTTDNRNVLFKRNSIRSGWIDTTNTSFGVAGLSSVTTAKYNTAFGAYALLSNNFGDANSAFGYGALAANVGGIRNTALGVNALAMIVGASDNTAVGTSSMTSTTTGIGNTSIGVQSLFSNTTGSANTASGYNALYTNMTGNNNTAQGFYSLVSNTGGNRNTASGDASLNINTTGNDNTAMGINAGASNTTGSGNTFLGAGADVNGGNLANVTVIGSGAKAFSSNSLILGSNSRVGIGTGSPYPSAQLEIVSNNKGILIPRMTSNERLAISFVTDGLLVYDVDTHSFWYYNYYESKWIDIASKGQSSPQYAPVQKTVTGGAASDKFGFSVAAGGGPAIVIGAPGRNLKCGSVYLGLEEVGNIYSYTEYPGADFSYVANDQFGYAVAINKDIGNADWIGGAPFDDNILTDQGSVVVKLTHGSGNKMYSPLPQANEVFGAAVGIAGHAFQNDVYFMVGAPGRNSGTGAAYIYWYNGTSYTLVQTINPIAPNPTDSFGHAVSISYNITNGEGWAFVGAPNDDVFLTDDGSVSVYKRNTTTGSWDFQVRMTSGEPIQGGHFGYSVASNMPCLSGVAIGEPGYFRLPTHPNRGRVYYSSFNGSSFQNPVVVDSGQYANNYFGNAVSVASNQVCNRSHLVVGSKGGPIDTRVNNWGMARFYTLLNNTGNWIRNGKTFDPEGDSGWQFGYSVGVNRNGNVVIGSPAANVGNNISQGKIRLESFPSY